MPEIQETWVRFPGQEYPLEKDMATNSSNFARKIPQQRSVAGCSTWVLKESTWLSTHVCSWVGEWTVEAKSLRGKTKNVGFLLNQPRIKGILAEGRRGWSRFNWRMRNLIRYWGFFLNWFSRILIRTGFYKDRDGSGGRGAWPKFGKESLCFMHCDLIFT